MVLPLDLRIFWRGLGCLQPLNVSILTPIDVMMVFDHISTMQNVLADGVAIDARNEELEADLSKEKASNNVVNALLQASSKEIEDLNAKLVAAENITDKERKGRKADYEKMEHVCRLRLLWFGERLHATCKKDHHGVDLSKPESEVPSGEEALYYSSLEDSLGFIHKEIFDTKMPSGENALVEDSLVDDEWIPDADANATTSRDISTSDASPGQDIPPLDFTDVTLVK
ncbi:uncharacterized protein [Euphorbia lathyris]|uniref:uncharacterized protein isoform X2 n=1 Tax=Euphorbia lathyris TaxID=212925 RepID=UPI0033143855